MKFFRKKAFEARMERDRVDHTEEKLDTIRDLAIGLMGRICM